MVARNNATTIVVPVYADWESLGQCITSLKKFVDKKHTILLVNDCGPEADLIEKNIKRSIKNTSNFVYYRNPKNLGFVKTCNRAVLELDQSDNDVLLFNSDAVATKGFLEEMVDVLYLDKQYGTVSPRSNSASNSSIPMRPINEQDYSMDYSHEIYKKIMGQLPRYYTVPDSHGFCMLIRRSLINKYGLFDEIYGRGNGEETDFCLRIQRHGFKSLVANRAYVYHFHSRSFSAEEKDSLKARNMKIVKERYPELDGLLGKFVNETVDPIDWFADTIAGTKSPYKIMIDLSHLPQVHDERSGKIDKLLKYLAAHGSAKIEYTIVTNPDVDEFFSFSRCGLRILYMGVTEELFHLGFCPFPVLYPNDINSINRMCLKFAYAVDEATATLSLPRNSSQYQVANDALLFADKVFISKPQDKEALVAWAGADTIKRTDVSVVESHKELAAALESIAHSQVATTKLRTRWSHINKAFTEKYNQPVRHKKIKRVYNLLMTKTKLKANRT